MVEEEPVRFSSRSFSCSGTHSALASSSFLFKWILFSLNGPKVNHRVWTPAKANVFQTSMSKPSSDFQTLSGSATQPWAEHAEKPQNRKLSYQEGLEGGHRVSCYLIFHGIINMGCTKRHNPHVTIITQGGGVSLGWCPLVPGWVLLRPWVWTSANLQRRGWRCSLVGWMLTQHAQSLGSHPQCLSNWTWWCMPENPVPGGRGRRIMNSRSSMLHGRLKVCLG